MALKNANWEQLKKDRDKAKAEGRLVGLGLSMYVEVCGIGPSASLPTGGWEHSQVTIERDGRITATTGASPHGQGNETTFAQMLADQFSVPFEHVTILHGDTAVVKQGIGTFGSRSQAVGGAALHMAGTKVKTKMAKFAAALLEAHEDDIVFENGRVSVKGAPAKGKTFAEVASYAYIPVPLPPGLEPGLSDEAFFEPSNNTYPFGCHISMLEIDRETGEPTLLRLVAVDDAGQPDQPADRRGADSRRPGPGHRPGDDRRGRLRRGRPAPHRLVHGLRAAPRDRLPALRARPHRDADAGQSARRQGLRRGRHARLDAEHRRGGRGRAERVRREAHRHDAAAREAVAHHPRRPGVISTSFDYARATSIDDAIARLGAASGSAKLLAGGHSLVPLMKLRLSEPSLLIDIARIPGLSGIREKGGKIEIGAATVHHEVATSALLLDKCPALAETAATIGDPQVRNRGTMGGSLAHADPAADYPAMLLALDAEIHLKGAAGWRAGEGERLLPGAVHRGSAARRDHRRRAVHAAARGRLRQAAPARLALRHRRRRRVARRVGRHDHRRRASA